MNLFAPNPDENLLPYEGTVNYFGPVLDSQKADFYFEKLSKNIEWKPDQAMIFGKLIHTQRKVAWYANESFEYSYSGIPKRALIWTDELLQLKEIVEKQCSETFNSCLLNLYHSGSEGMAWHSDGEKDLKKNGAIASLTFGAERKFAFKHKLSGEKVELLLEHGSLLIMKGETQSSWLHRLPPTKKASKPRINLTFRTIIK